MNSAQRHQELAVNKPVEELIPSSNVTSNSKANNNLSAGVGGTEKKPAGTVVRPPNEQPHPCPRCNSINTKFCYYNNYSLTQPRYFCKGCRRYWTEGGSLRNIPVGGGSRKHKRSPTSTLATPSGVASKNLFVHPSHQSPYNNTMIQQNHQPERAGHDLNLSFETHHQGYRSISDFVHMPTTTSQAADTTTGSSHLSALELLAGMTSRGSVGLGAGAGLFSNTFMPLSDPDLVYSSASFSNFMHDFKPPTLNFSLDNGLGLAQSGGGGGFGNTAHNDSISSTTGPGGGRISPFGDMKINQQVDNDLHQHQTDQSRGHGVPTGYWTGMLGGGGGSDW